MFRNTTSRALLGLALWLMAGAAVAGSFNVRPTRLDLSMAEPSGMLTVTNPGDSETTVQVIANAWRQEGIDDLQEPSRDLIAVPPLFILPPGGQQVVRVALRYGPAPGAEAAYRLLLREVPPPPEQGFAGLQVALNLSLPVFVAPPDKVHPDLKWSMERCEDGAVRLHADNRGGAHVKLTSVRLSSPDLVIEGRDLPVYLLPGQGRSWPVDSRAAASANWTIAAETDAGPVQADIVMQSD